MRYQLKEKDFAVDEHGQIKRLRVMTVVGTRPELIKLSRVIAELERREGMSGIEEKALRKSRDREQNENGG